MDARPPTWIRTCHEELDSRGHEIGRWAGDALPARPDACRAEVHEVIRASATDELGRPPRPRNLASWVREHGDPARLLLDLMA